MQTGLIDHQTRMSCEIEEISDSVQRLIDNNDALCAALGERLRSMNPAFITTIARGSSDHAASYLKYAFEISCGIPVSSISPSVHSIYKQQLNLTNTMALAISQSGQSPDIVQMSKAARQGGAFVLSLTNTIGSPLQEVSDQCLNLSAGPELSVAATKSFVCSVVAGLLVLAHWQKNHILLENIKKLPFAFDQARQCAWDNLSDALLRDAPSSLFVLGRGPCFSIACEAALKFKETCQIHAEPFSAAEVMHGPLSLVDEGFKVLAFSSADAAEQSLFETVEQLAQRGADVFITSAHAPQGTTALPCYFKSCPLTQPLVHIASFYAFIEKLACRKNLNPDMPPHLKKVTETL